MPDRVIKLLWALGVSLALHLALLFGPNVPMPTSLAPAPILEAKLVKLPPPPPVPTQTLKPVKPPPAAKPKSIKEIPALPVETAPAPEVQPHATPALAETPPAVAPEPAIPVLPTMPQRVVIRFTLLKEPNDLNVGRAEQTWELDGERYTISSVAEATGLFSLFASGKHIQLSQGEFTRSGLKPSSYRVERGQGAGKTDTARFDWSAMTLTLAGDSSKTLKLPEGTQDLLSFMYQLAFAPPQRSAVQLSITNGRKLDSYAYWVVEEALDTPMGRLKTLHLGKQREPGEKDTEVWLAADYHYLPVKISQLDKDGDGLIMLANEIAITQ